MFILQNNSPPPPGGFHKVDHDLLISASKKAKYRSEMSEKVNNRLKNTFVKKRFLIFKYKVSQLEIICNKLGSFTSNYSQLWNIAYNFGSISKHERDILNLKALDFSKVEAMLISNENFLSTIEMMKLLETLKIEEV